MLQLWLKLEEKQKKDQFCQSLFGQFTTDKWLMENRRNGNEGIDVVLLIRHSMLCHATNFD